MRQLYNVIFVLCCGFALVRCKWGSDILNLANSGHVDNKQPNSAVSTLSPILCKGDGSITCACYDAGKTRAYFQWNGLNQLYSNYNNVELDSVFVLLSYSCSEGSPDLWNGIDVYQVNSGSFNKASLTWNNQPALTYLVKLNTWQYKLDLSVMDAVLKRGDYSFAIALDSGNSTENLNFYGMSRPDQATLAIYAQCKAGWAYDANGQCTVATPLPPVTTPTTPPVIPPVTAPINPPTPPVTVPVSVPVATTVTPPVTVPIASPVSVPVSVPVTQPVAVPINAPVTVPVATPMTTPTDTPTTQNTPPVTVPISVPMSDDGEPMTAPQTIEAPLAAPTKINVPQAIAGIVSSASTSTHYYALVITILSLLIVGLF